MKLKCTASIGGMYWKSNEKSAEGMKQKRGAATMDGLAAGDDPGTGKERWGSRCQATSTLKMAVKLRREGEFHSPNKLGTS